MLRAVTTDAPPELDLPALTIWFEQGIPYNKMLGLKVDHIARGECTLRIPWRHELIGDVGRPALHGGVTSMIADTAGGCACFTMLERPTDRVSTVDLRVDYLRPGRAQDVVCRAKIVRVGNRVGVARMEVFSGDADEDAEPIATGQGVYNILRR